MLDVDLEHLREWVGRETRTRDLLAAGPARALAATLDQALPEDGDEVPPAWHWIYFHTLAPMSSLGEDGHAQRGGFLPPVPLPRRMWAGGRIEWHAPLRIGTTAERCSTVSDITLKHGRSGRLAFVPVRHELRDGDGRLCLEERHDVLFREAPRADAPPPTAPPAPRGSEWTREVRPDPVLLFRYSALTFNGHRIHYDRDYCREREGYPGLVVHGPLIATLLLDLLRRSLPGARPRTIEYRAVSPLFDLHRFSVNGRLEGDHCRLWASNHEGGLAMSAEVRLA